MDAEGGLHGERPGKAWMAINIGVTAGLAKEVDDGVQLVIEAIVSTATDASTAGTARIAATCVSVLYMATRKGRDVVLPRFTEVDISLDRPASLHAASEFDSSSSSSAAK
jgi:ABC-type antimicrobial peptide transport system ATPase subunit